MEIKIETPITKEKIKNLKAGDNLLITGIIYTARDAAHKRMIENYKNGEDFPIEIKNQTIYFAGPSPAKPNQPTGAIGPTTSGRMDSYSPYLMDLGLSCMIGKGLRDKTVISSIIKNSAVYLGAIGGAGALLSKSVKKSEVVAYADLGSEAIHRLEVENFPATVIIDSQGNNLYETEIQKYKK